MDGGSAQNPEEKYFNWLRVESSANLRNDNLRNSVERLD